MKHAEASYVEIDLDLSPVDFVSVRVEDDGTGFDLSRTSPAVNSGLGLFGMHERVNLIGGQMTVDSSPGEGTELRVTVPVGAPDTVIGSPLAA